MSTQYAAVKDPDASLPFGFDWSSWVTTGDSVASCTVSVTSPSGDGSPITAGTPSVSSNISSAVLSAGTAGNSYTVTFRVTTASGYIDDRSIFIRVVNR